MKKRKKFLLILLVFSFIIFASFLVGTSATIVLGDIGPLNSSPQANAGPDKSVFENESIILEGSGSDPDGDPLSYYWSCTGGSLSNPRIARPTYTAPSVESHTTYTCTLTVKDSLGESDSDSMKVSVVNALYCIVPLGDPEAAIVCDPSECQSTDCIAYTGCPFHLLNQSTDPDGQEDIVKSEWDIIGWGSEPDLSCSGICDFTPPTNLLTPGTYQVELYVEDSAGNSDTATENFYLKREAQAGFMCSLDNENWQACETLIVSRNQTVYFKDDPSLPEHSLPSEGAIINFREWKLREIDPSTHQMMEEIFDKGNNPNPHRRIRGSTIELTIRDSAGRTASVSHEVSSQLPLPEYREIPPIIWLKKLFAGIVDIFDGFLPKF